MRTVFSGADTGSWRIDEIRPICGAGLAPAARLQIGPPAETAAWSLEGVGSNLRYLAARDRPGLAERSAPLRRAGATCAVLIPISKSESWWALAQDERDALFRSSRHLGIGLDYAQSVARQLFHSRDLGGDFDFLTWFEFAPDDEMAFDEMLERLRASLEWTYVTREVEIRLSEA
jgi:chlorite dismutase